ncbi:dematin isoform X1 [Apteryx rowi]|uniref:dematin isoform X1 n=1 Tax=Apteryx rowi TaxID=308060 RepID=UPI000E1D8E8F|nr:dematin isoform X1 [Apteryx rowi]
MERLQKQSLTSPGSVCSSRGSSVPGSPSSIVAKMDNEVLGYKDLAAIPKDKAILDIERPDLMIYEPHFTYSLMEHVELPRSRERSLSPKSISPPPSPEVVREWLESRSPGIAAQSAPRHAGTAARSSVQHFHRPETDTTELNIYKKPPIYRQKEHHPGAHHGKHLIEDLIIESSKFPAAQPPDPNQPAKIETDYWPCPPSLAVVETEWRRRMASKRGEEEEEDLTEEMKNLRELQKQELSKVTSNLGKLILKEEMEKSLPIRRKTRSLPDRTPFHTSLHMGSYKSSSLPASGRSTLTRLQSAEFSSAGSDKGSPGLQVSARLAASAETQREERPARAHGQRQLPAQHAGAEDLPLRNADGDQQRPCETAPRRGQDQARAAPLPRGFPAGLRDVPRGVQQAGPVEAQRAEEESLPLLSPPRPRAQSVSRSVTALGLSAGFN